MHLEIFMAIGYLLMSSAIGLSLFNTFVVYTYPQLDNVERINKVLIGASLIFMVLGALCTFLHLGNKLNVLFILTQITSSWLTRESWLIGLFIVLSAVYMFYKVKSKIEVTNKTNRVFTTLLSVIGIVLIMFMSFAYMAVGSIPVWNNASVLVTNLAEALALGAALGALIVCFIFKGNVSDLRKITSYLGVCIALAVFAYIVNIASVLLLPEGAYIINGNIISLSIVKALALLAALVVTYIWSKKSKVLNKYTASIVLITVLVVLSDVISRVLHFIVATHMGYNF